MKPQEETKLKTKTSSVKLKVSYNFAKNVNPRIEKESELKG